MIEIEFDDFYKIVMQHTATLRERGYSVRESEFQYIIEFTNTIKKADCTIGYQWLPSGMLSTTEFNIWLRRLRHPEETDNTGSYTNLQMDLRNLLVGKYDVDPLPKSHPGYWRIEDISELSEQLEEVQSLIMEYGIPWLEDPNSDMDWLFK